MEYLKTFWVAWLWTIYFKSCPKVRFGTHVAMTSQMHVQHASLHPCHPVQNSELSSSRDWGMCGVEEDSLDSWKM